MSALWRRPDDVDKLLADSRELRETLAATVKQLERFVEAFNAEARDEPKREPGDQK